MTALIDTSVVIRHCDRTDPQHSLVQQHLADLVARDCALAIVAQVIYEFWTVATRPAGSNGLGLTPAAAHAQVRLVLSTFPVLPDPPDLLGRWMELCLDFSVSGRPAHDARLVAIMMCQRSSR